MNSRYFVKQSIIDIIQKKYQIVEVIDLRQYSANAEALAEKLHNYHNACFENNQRLVVLHHDTDYYPDLNCVGNLIFNFLTLCADYCISVEKIIFVTNHYGIKNEIEYHTTQICNASSPTVIYTSQWYDFPDLKDVIEVSQSTTNCDYLFCCLNNRCRQHRTLTLCMLQEYGLLSRGIISHHFGT